MIYKIITPARQFQSGTRQQIRLKTNSLFCYPECFKSKSLCFKANADSPSVLWEESKDIDRLMDIIASNP